MQWSVGLEDYEIHAAHGFYDEEHEEEQPFVFTVWATLGSTERVDSLDQTLNYADIQIAIDEVVLKAPEPIRLMETMAQQIIERLSQNGAVASLSVRIEKPMAPLPHPGGSPVIEVLWSRG
tara:strand:+ start:1332 stop:1694 length:363 start_codon:yes stop_codon:yes gene_type:complete